MSVVEDQIDRVGSIIKAVAALFALLPFVAMLLGLVSIPPDIGQLIKGLTLAVSIIIILAIIMIAPRLAMIDPMKVGISLLIMAILGSILATSYMLFAQNHIVSAKGDHVVPLNPSKQIRDIMTPYGDDYGEALQTSSSAPLLANLMKSQRGGAVAVMVVLLVSAEVMLVAAVVGGAWYLVARRGDASAATPTPSADAPPQPPV